MSRKYAKGRHAVAECQRSGQKMRYRDLVEDGHIPGLLVHPDWWEPKHPQEIPVTVDDPIALYRPAPEISVPTGYGQPENLDGGTTPVEPTLGDSVTTANQSLSAGDTHVVIEDPAKYTIGQWVFIALDGGGWFASRITTTADSPAYTIPFTTPFSGAASAGNSVYFGDATGVPVSTLVASGDVSLASITASGVAGQLVAGQTITVTVGRFSNFTSFGYDVSPTVGSVSPDPPLLTVEAAEVTRIMEIENDSGGAFTFRFEAFGPGTDPGASILFTTFSTIEIDHSGGTVIADTRDLGNGGDMQHSFSTEGSPATFYFPNFFPRKWGTIGEVRDVRFIE